jgi:hypothetical protein
MGVLHTFNTFSNGICGTFGVLLIIICMAGIIGLAVLMVVKIPYKSIDIVVHMIGCCIFMIPALCGIF